MGLDQLIASLFGIQPGSEPEKLEKGSYAYFEIDFEDNSYQGNDVRLTLPGKMCSKVEYSGDKQDATLKIGNKRADPLPLSKIKSLKSVGGFDEIFLSSTDTHGKLSMVVSAGVISEVKPTIQNEVTDSRRIFETDCLVVDTTGEEDFLYPSTGKALELLGFNAIIAQRAPTMVSGGVKMYLKTDAGLYEPVFKYLTVGDGVGDNSVHTITMSNLTFRGGIDQPIQLENMNWGGGTSVKASVTLYYREV